MIEQVKFGYSPLGIAFEKQIKTTEYQGKEKVRTIEDHGKQLVESNELIKNDFNIDGNSIRLDEQKKNIS